MVLQQEMSKTVDIPISYVSQKHKYFLELDGLKKLVFINDNHKNSYSQYFFFIHTYVYRAPVRFNIGSTKSWMVHVNQSYNLFWCARSHMKYDTHVALIQ